MSENLNEILETKTSPSKSEGENLKERFEDRLSAWGLMFSIFGILSGIGCVYLAGIVNKEYSFQSWGQGGFAWYLLIAGVAAILQGMFVKMLLEAGAEIIRLLRKLNNK